MQPGSQAALGAVSAEPAPSPPSPPELSRLSLIGNGIKIRAIRFWNWAAVWNWWAIVVSGALGSMLRIGEYVLTMLLLSIAALGATSRIVHSGGMTGAAGWERKALKALGILAVILGFAYMGTVTTANAVKDNSWSNFPHLWAFVMNGRGASSKLILSFKAYVAPMYKEGDMVGGFKWINGFQDVRIIIENISEAAIQNLDLTIRVLDKSGDLIGGMGQASDIGGVEFHGPESPEAGLRLLGDDGKVYDTFFRDFLPKGETFPPFGDHWGMFCPRLPTGISLRLVVAAINIDDKVTRDTFKGYEAPKHLRLIGSYDSPEKESGKRVKFEQLLDITR